MDKENLVEPWRANQSFKVLGSFGRVDVLVNNAGANSLIPVSTFTVFPLLGVIAVPSDPLKMHAQNPQDFNREFMINFQGPYYLMRLILPKLREQRSGCILNVASRAGTVEIPFSTSYCASKAALINLTACVQKECDIEGYSDIHMYSLHPGGVKSEMTLSSMTSAVTALVAKTNSLTRTH